MKKLNNYIRNGLLIYVLCLLFNQFFQLPEFLNGFFLGLAITLMIWGGYAENHDITKIKNYKKRILLKIKNI
ncbi:MAG: hypothetical protein HUJ77_01095 [Clostridium sp.]|uniref:hypothetical protein n=1 Tax=Clostridium sp. TaxID=1506 RepID=UPI0025BAAB36|nr:hypothetical protein [Clostridium sp.]MCF0146971.1 hypothetical protein [Clostridium sp.]